MTAATTTKSKGAKAIAVEILRRADGPLPMKEIAARVLASKSCHLKGKTPQATIAAQLYTEATKPDGKIVKVDHGLFDLRDRASA